MSDRLIIVTADLQEKIGIKLIEAGNLYIKIANIKKDYAKKNPKGVAPKSNFGKKSTSRVDIYF